MKKIVCYEAFDGETFRYYDACKAYEDYKIKLIDRLLSKIKFYDGAKEIIPITTNNYDEKYDRLADVLNICIYIYIGEMVTEAEQEMIRHDYGFIFPFNGQVGLYRWDDAYMKWVVD